jgi:hypothetical protein
MKVLTMLQRIFAGDPQDSIDETSPDLDENPYLDGRSSTSDGRMVDHFVQPTVLPKDLETNPYIKHLLKGPHALSHSKWDEKIDYDLINPYYPDDDINRHSGEKNNNKDLLSNPYR